MSICLSDMCLNALPQVPKWAPGSKVNPGTYFKHLKINFLIREGAMVLRHVRGKTLKIIVKNLLAPPEIDVKMVHPP